MIAVRPLKDFINIAEVHPLYNSQPAYEWIKMGSKISFLANTGREMLNFNGEYNLEDHKAIVQESETITDQSKVSVLKEISRRQKYGMIYIILYNARYYRSEFVRKYVEAHNRLKLIFLPPYSPNLNMIERLWKFFKKKVLYNTYYEKFAVFREYCLQFFRDLNLYRDELEILMTDNFQLIQA